MWELPLSRPANFTQSAFSRFKLLTSQWLAQGLDSLTFSAARAQPSFAGNC